MTTDADFRDAAAHDAARALLPWYVSGRLDGEDLARVEAHLASCGDCRAEVRFERRLADEVSRLPLDVEAGWARMRMRLGEPAARGRRRWDFGLAAARAALSRAARPAGRDGAALLAAPAIGWGVAAAMALSLGLVMLRPAPPAAGYHVLSAASQAQAGNIVVVFRPEATERRIREILTGSEARLVDGPTAADGYVLRVAPERRTAALTALKAEREVVLAEPIDPATP